MLRTSSPTSDRRSPPLSAPRRPHSTLQTTHSSAPPDIVEEDELIEDEFTFQDSTRSWLSRIHVRSNSDVGEDNDSGDPLSDDRNDTFAHMVEVALTVQGFG